MDGKPYLLTSLHNLENISELEFYQWIFFFGYESTSCSNPSSNPSSKSLVGAELKAKHEDSDFLLLELINSVPPNYQPYFNGWDISGTAPSSGAIIHHPGGDIKKIALDDDRLTSYSNSYNGTPNNSHWMVTLDKGTTEPGSSGAPLFDSNSRIVGQNHGGLGDPLCSNPRKVYGKLSWSWDRGGTAASSLKQWLNPINAGVSTLNGAYLANYRDLEIVELDDLDFVEESGVSVKLKNNANISYSFSNAPVRIVVALDVYDNDGQILQYTINETINQGSIAAGVTQSFFLNEDIDLSNAGSVCYDFAPPQQSLSVTPNQRLELPNNSNEFPLLTSNSSSKGCVVNTIQRLAADFTAPRRGLNIDEAVQISSAITNSTGSVSYSWDFGLGAVSSDHNIANPIVQYSTPGNKNVSLNVTDDNGSVVASKNAFFVVNNNALLIDADFSGCGNSTTKTVNFLNETTGGYGFPYNSYLWDFGDGNFSNEKSPTHTYRYSGDYNVSLKVCDDTGCHTIVKSECVNIPAELDPNDLEPKFQIQGEDTFFPVQVGLNSPVHFVDASTGGNETNPDGWDYDWYFDWQASPNTANPQTENSRGPHSVIYSADGVKEVNYVVDDGRAARSFTINSAVDVVEGLGALGCYANIGDISVSSYCWQATNLPELDLDINEVNCPVSKTEVWMKHAGSEVISTLPGKRLDFNTLGITPTFPYTTQFYFHVFQNDGISDNIIGTKRVELTFYGPVSANAGNDKDICLNDGIQIGSGSASGMSYQWSGNGSGYLDNKNQATPTFIGSAEEVYDLTLTVTNQSTGCSKTDNVTVEVGNVTVSNSNTTAGLGVDKSLSSQVSGGFGSNSYNWSPPTFLNSTTSASPTFNSNSEGEYNYNVNVTDDNGCSDSGVVTVNVTSTPLNLTALAEAYGRISLTWDDNTSDETGFALERSDGDQSSFQVVTSTGANITTYDDTNITAGITYYYRIAANRPEGQTSYSNVASANTSSLPEFTNNSNNSLFPINYRVTLALIDYDNDSDLDLAYMGQSGQYLLWENNNGVYSGLWVPPGNDHQDIESMDWGDFDNDSDMDLIVSHFNHGIQQYENDNATFTLQSNLTTGNICKYVDYDSDNDLDIVVVDDNSVKILKNNEGSYSSNFIIDNAGGNITWHGVKAIESTDLDNDGDIDIVVSYADIHAEDKTKQNLLYFINEGNDNFTRHTIGTNLNAKIELSDYDLDGDMDILATGPKEGIWEANWSRIYKNNNGSLSLNDFTNTEHSEAVFGDFNYDGRTDIFSQGDVSSNKIYYNNGNGFSPSALPNWSFKNNGRSAAGDIENDGDLDLILFGGHGNAAVVKNNRLSNKYRSNTPPSPPSGLCLASNGNDITFSWESGDDDETPASGLTYNLYVKKNGKFIVSPLANLSTGYRKVTKTGNVDQNKSWTIKNLDIDVDDEIEWGVQSIDNTYAGSTFITNTFTALNSLGTLCGSYRTLPSLVEAHDVIVPFPGKCNYFTMNGNSSTVFRAVNKVVLKPGVTIERGAEFKAEIITENVPATCSGGPLYRGMADLSGDPVVGNGPEKVMVYPNPSDGVFNLTIQLEEPAETLTYKVYNMNGVVLGSKDLSFLDIKYLNQQINLESYGRGLFLLRIAIDDKQYIKKLVVK